MTRLLYDLAGAEEERRFSPYCWRVKMALAHKGLAVETIPWRFTDKKAIAFSGQDRVPVLVDGDTVVADSWLIAVYLDETYPDAPLFGSSCAMAHALLIKYWLESTIHPLVFRIIGMDIYRHLHPRDRNYFRRSREARVGMSLEVYCSQKESSVAALRQSLGPAREVIRAHPWLGGEQPSFVDYMLFGAFQWARAVSSVRLLKPQDPLYDWRARMLDAFDGFAARAPGYAA